MKKLCSVTILFFLTTFLSAPAFSFCIMELKADIGFIGGSRYVNSGYEMFPYPFSMNWGLDFHFVYPLKKKSGDHIGIGFGANSSVISASSYSGTLDTRKELSLYTYWLKIPIVFTYCIIGEGQGYMNFDFGIYYSIPLWASRSVEIAEASVNSTAYIPPESMNPSYGLHFQFTLGFGIEQYINGGHPYPGITGLGIGASLDISLSDQLNLPGEDFGNWDFGIIFTWPFFLFI